jgi:hypothetical protein
MTERSLAHAREMLESASGGNPEPGPAAAGS